ncbi:hypothetical protein, partial [Acidocella sp.]|uniref:hypothetical protein n=1 Tax=Acidocella sp. TaxID=50710 RepID=UPI00262F7722
MPITTIEAQKVGLALSQAKVLSFVSHLLPKSKVTQNGLPQVVITREVIMEKCELTREQVRRAVERLVEYELLTIEVHLWGRTRKSFMRPTLDTLVGWERPAPKPLNERRVRGAKKDLQSGL